MAEAILRRAGLRTGLYTSPHLARFTERIRVDGREADGDRLAALDLQVQAAGERLTYFEIATVLGFPGLRRGGRSTSPCWRPGSAGGWTRSPAASRWRPPSPPSGSITRTTWAPRSPTSRARRPASSSPRFPCFVGRVPGEAAAVIARGRRTVGAPLRWLGTDFSAPAAHVWVGGPAPGGQRGDRGRAGGGRRRRLGRPLDGATIAAALGEVRWPGRLERLADDLWVDCAHNAAGRPGAGRGAGGDAGLRAR